MLYTRNVLRGGIFRSGGLSHGLRVHDPCNRNEMRGWIVLPSQGYGGDGLQGGPLLYYRGGGITLHQRKLLPREKHVTGRAGIG